MMLLKQKEGDPMDFIPTIDYTLYPDAQSQAKHLRARSAALRGYLRGEPGDRDYDAVMLRIMKLDEMRGQLERQIAREPRTAPVSEKRSGLLGFLRMR
jgi:hypothetical protein